MPRGRKKKEVVETATDAVTVVAEAPIVEEVKAVEAPKSTPKPVLTEFQQKLAESRKVLEIPLQPSQEFFESPEGFIVIGEKGRGRVWCREANNYQGMFINPRR